MAATGNEIIYINGDEVTLDQLVTMVYDILEQRSTDVSQFPVATSLTGISSLPALRIAGATSEVVTVSISLLKGTDGKEVELRLSSGDNAAIQWKYAGATEWQTLLTLAAIQAPAVDAATEVLAAMAGITRQWEDIEVEVSEAVDNANHTPYIGEDYYVYKWNPQTQSYDKTDVFLKGAPFSIIEIYTSVAQMEADIDNPEIKVGDFVLINTGDVEDPDNAQVYIKAKNADDSFSYQFVVDMSGAVGFTGKTPQYTIGTVDSTTPGANPSVAISPNGTDTDGNPRFLLNFVFPTGDTGPVPVIRVGTVTTGEPGTEAEASLEEDGLTSEGVQKYILNLTIPEGMPGSGSGNVYADPGALESGKKYLFSPTLDGLPVGTFVEYTIPLRFSGDYNDLTNKPYISPITLDHIPGSTDTFYLENGEQKPYPIGAEVRYYDEENEEYVFYKLHDIEEDEAVWKIAGSGGSVDMREQLTIRLTSNQAQPDAALIGAVITVDHAGGVDTYTWEGTAIKTSLAASTECTVSVSQVEGYSLPGQQHFTTGIQSERTIEFAYNSCILTVDFTSNQSDTSDIANATAEITYGDTAITVSVADNIVKVPHEEEITITYSTLPGYKTPIEVSKIFTAANETQVAIWKTEVISIILSADNAESLNGQIVTVTDGSTELLNAIWEGNTLSLKIPYDTQYVVSSDSREGFTKPEDQSYTAVTISRVVTMIYAKVNADYITIDQNITDPETMISGNVNGEIIQWIRNNSHRYLGKYTAAGKMTVCQLDDTDSTKYTDGTTAVLTGTEGDVWMKLPRFFYHAEEIETDIWQIGFGLDKVDATWKEWDGNDLIGVYESYNSSSKAYSRSGVTSTPSVSQANWKTYARARGEGYTLVKHKHQNIMAFLFYAEYGNTNCQALIGAGTNVTTKVTGATDALGMADTQAATNGNTQSITFWGLENWWGNKYEWIDNVVINPVSDNGVWRVTEDDGTTRDVQGVTGSVYVKKMVIGEHLDVVNKTSDAASSTTGYCDYQQVSTSTARVVARSCPGSHTYGGVAYAYASHDSSYTFTYIGSRLAFRGEITGAESVAAYKAIIITN